MSGRSEWPKGVVSGRQHMHKRLRMIETYKTNRLGRVFAIGLMTALLVGMGVAVIKTGNRFLEFGVGLPGAALVLITIAASALSIIRPTTLTLKPDGVEIFYPWRGKAEKIKFISWGNILNAKEYNGRSIYGILLRLADPVGGSYIIPGSWSIPRSKLAAKMRGLAEKARPAP
jgi:hypothetical protein